ncbi:MAG: ERF family protein, partial [Bacteroidaceae bacterium]|nr:ERF family protein [Bacteroidaceae bacterium]
MKELLEALIYIQQNLSVPKDQFNAFGKYNYRSLESILAAIKPLLRSQNCGIRFEDEVIELGGRTFLKTTLYFFNDKGETITTCAIAEHTATKTGMDAAQITGAASSYARKYAMNALFAIDDTKDADTEAYQQQQQLRKTAQRRTTTTAPRATQAPAADSRYAAIEKALK